MNHNTSSSPLHSSFTRQFIELNTLQADRIQSWLISPEMGFGSTRKWWGDLNSRTAEHEGIDLGFFQDQSQGIHCINQTMIIPALFDGELVHRFDDFLGETLVFQSTRDNGNPNTSLVFAYGHVVPENELAREVKAGQGVARIAAVERQSICSHLHVTVGKAVKNTLHLLTSWENIANPELIQLLDPRDHITDITLVDRSLLFTP